MIRLRDVNSIISIVLIAAMAVAEDRIQGPVEETGEIGGAPFQISIPANWNGGLVMYAHGYESVAPKRRDFDSVMPKVGAELGYAVAQSQYTKQGWAAREGILDTEALRRYFWDKYGQTWPTIIAGHSQGGAITYKTIEVYSEVYDGALPMCALSEPALKFFKERVFDMRLLFDYFFPGLPGSVVEFPHGEQTLAQTAIKVSALVRENKELAEEFIQWVNLPNVEQIPPVIAFWTEILRELQIRCGGNAFDNVDTIYVGTNDDPKLNREIPRYTAEPKAVEYLRNWSTPTGEISDPVVALHTFIDQLTPAEGAAWYEQMTQLKGTDGLFVQLYVDRFGHCAFSPLEIREALTRLDRWIRDGVRPESGEITVKKE